MRVSGEPQPTGLLKDRCGYERLDHFPAARHLPGLIPLSCGRTMLQPQTRQMIGGGVGALNSWIIVCAQVKVRAAGQERQDICFQVMVCPHPPGIMCRPPQMQAPVISVRRDADLAPLAFSKEIASRAQVGTLHAYPSVSQPPNMVPTRSSTANLGRLQTLRR